MNIELKIFEQADLNYLVGYMNNISDDLRKEEMLSNDTIKQRFILAGDNKPFKDLIETLNEEELKLFLNKESMELLASNSMTNKVETIMNLETASKNDILSSNTMIYYLYKNYLNLKDSFKNLDYKVANNFLEYMIENDLYICMDKLSYFKDEVILEAIKNNIKDIKNNVDKLPNNFISLFGPLTIEYLVSQKQLEKSFFNYDIKSIEKMLIEGIKIPDEVIENKIFIDNLINTLDVKLYRSIINYLKNNNDMSIVEKIENLKQEKTSKDINNIKDDLLPDFKNILDSVISTLPDNDQAEREIDSSILKKLPSNMKKEVIGILYATEKQPINEFKEVLKNYLVNKSDEELLDLTIDSNYKMNSTDFMSDFQFITMNNELTSSISNKKRQLISREHYDNYLTLINFSVLSTKEKIEFFNSFDKTIDYKQSFDDDLKAVDNFLLENKINNNLTFDEITQENLEHTKAA